MFEGISTENVSLPASVGLGAEDGRVDPGLGPLTADTIDAYRAAGALIGEGVTIGAGTTISAPQIAIEDGVVFGADCSVQCDELFAVGALTHFAPRLEVRCRRAYWGANGHVGRDVRVGGGGARDPWGIFAAGDLLFLGDEAYVNPARPVLVGREVFLTMRSMIVTHNIGHSLLEGFENRFAPVIVEDRAQVGLGTVIYAGCRIGREAIVASNSYVVSNIAAGRLAIGVPAKEIADSARPPSPDRQKLLLRQIVTDLGELLTLRGEQVTAQEDGFSLGNSVVLAVDDVGPGFKPPAADGEVVVLTLAVVGDPPGGCAVLDLLERRVHGTGGIVLDSVREYCRKRGIRLEPGPWRYSGGLV